MRHASILVHFCMSIFVASNSCAEHVSLSNSQIVLRKRRGHLLWISEGTSGLEFSSVCQSDHAKRSMQHASILVKFCMSIFVASNCCAEHVSVSNSQSVLRKRRGHLLWISEVAWPHQPSAVCGMHRFWYISACLFLWLPILVPSMLAFLILRSSSENDGDTCFG